MEVAQQVEIIFAATNGYLDDVEVPAIKAWEAAFHEYMAATHPEIAAEIRSRKVLSDDLTARLRKAIGTYKALKP